MVELYPHQIEAIGKLQSGSILNGDTGSGKSLTAIAYYYISSGGKIDTELTSPDKFLPLLIITTASKRDKMEWEDELCVFDLYPGEQDITINSWQCIERYVGFKNGFVIFDEQRVGGTGPWAAAFRKITKNNKWIILTATPGDAWAEYMNIFIANGFYKDMGDFRAQHCVYATWTPYQHIIGYRNLSKLYRYRREITVFMPYEKKTIQHHKYYKAKYDKELYSTVHDLRWNPWEEKPIDNAGDICLKLRKVVNSDPSRASKVLEWTTEHPKVIIFYSFDFELEILESIPYTDGTVIGEWNGHKHQEVPKSDRWVYLVNYRAGAEGWNCTETDTMIFYSETYSYKDMKQAAGRIDRLNTPFADLYYYHFRDSSDISVAIDTALKNKKKFNEKDFVYSQKLLP